MNVRRWIGSAQSFHVAMKVLCPAVIFSFSMMLVVPRTQAQDAAAPVPPPTSTSTDSSQGSTPSSAGMQAGAGVATLLYFPFKAAFAIAGGIVGGLAYAFSGGNEAAAKSIWTTSLYGTYIITPDHLNGDKPVRFLGVAEPDSAAPMPPAEPVR